MAPLRRRGRPAAQRLDPNADSRALLLRAALVAWTEKGYSMVGLDDILRSAQVSKGSFYHHFATKEAFGLAVIEAYGEYFARKLARWFDATEGTPLARWQGFVQDATEGMARHGFRRGCLIGNLGQEMGALPESFRAALITTFADWQARTRDCLQAAADAGEIAPTADAATLAQWFWIGWEGAVLRAKLERSAQALDAFSTGFLQLLAPTQAKATDATRQLHPHHSTQENPHVSSPVD